MLVLVLNSGSSSIKYRLYRMPGLETRAEGSIDRIGLSDCVLAYRHGAQEKRIAARVADHREGIDLILDTLAGKHGVIEAMSEIEAVGHRVVHGGEDFTGSVRITEEVVASIERAAALAPLHNPPNLTGIRAAREALPEVPQVACFDTAFHTTLPPAAYHYALPHELYEELGVRRYGFHGTSHRYVARRAAALLGLHKYAFSGITCHLGNGCSLAAVRDGRSVDTTMGLTPLEGLVMGTRSGDVDPGVLLHLARRGYDTERLDRLLNKESGLLGLSGASNDMRVLLDRASFGDPRARLAIDVFVYRLKKHIGAFLAVLGRPDALVFTGGIGEHAAPVRAAACEGLEPLGIVLDPDRNAALRGEGVVSAPDSAVTVLVVPTDEEAAIAADTYRIAIDPTPHRDA